jgi:site-specific recombinase XerC
MYFTAAIDLFVHDLEAAKKSPATVRGYREDLHHFSHQLPRDTVLAITPETITSALHAWSARGLGRNTIFRRQTAIRAFCRWGRKQRLWLENPADLVDGVHQEECLPRPFEPAEAERIWALELPDVEDLARALLMFTGLRVGSICALNVGGVNADMLQLRVVVKRGRTQAVEVHPILATKLAAHLLTRTGAKAYDPLLCYPSGKRLNRRTIQKWTARWGATCEPPVPNCTCHRFRHLFGSTLLDQTSNLRTVQEALGHASIRSTQQYTRIRSSQVREAILKLPWRTKESQ